MQARSVGSTATEGAQSGYLITMPDLIAISQLFLTLNREMTNVCFFIIYIIYIIYLFILHMETRMVGILLSKNLQRTGTTVSKNIGVHL